MTSRKMFPLLFRNMPHRKKQLVFVALTTAALTIGAVDILLGLATNEGHWYLQSFGMLLLVTVGFLEYRRSTNEERDESESGSSDAE